MSDELTGFGYTRNTNLDGCVGVIIIEQVYLGFLGECSWVKARGIEDEV